MKSPHKKRTPENRSRDAWLSLGLVVLWLAATVLYAAVHASPWNSIVVPLLVILSLAAAFSFAVRSLDFWPARIALVLICAFVIIPPIAKQLRPDPFPSFKDQISKGMMIEEVKQVLGEPEKSERLGKLAKVPIDFPLYDDEGNPSDHDHAVKVIEGDLLLHFKIRRTTVVEAGGIELVQRCVPKRLFDRHFSQYVPPTKTDASMPPSDRLAAYLDEPWSFEEEILALGEQAIPALLEFLPTKYGYYGAVLLGKLGVRDQRVIDALREACAGEGGLAESSARALFRLGDIDFLFDQTGVAATRAKVVTAIVSGLKSQSVDPLDYRFVEGLLNSGDPEVVKVVNEQLVPGSSFCEITSTDLDEAFRGLESPHEVIRRHAVSVLGDRSLGRKVAKQVLSKLAERLQDPNANVRRLTLLSLAQWKAAAKPYHDQMLRMTEDPDREVRITATYVFE